jgi:hypothetical protein
MLKKLIREIGGSDVIMPSHATALFAISIGTHQQKDGIFDHP